MIPASRAACLQPASPACSSPSTVPLVWLASTPHRISPSPLRDNPAQNLAFSAPEQHSEGSLDRLTVRKRCVCPCAVPHPASAVSFLLCGISIRRNEHPVLTPISYSSTHSLPYALEDDANTPDHHHRHPRPAFVPKHSCKSQTFSVPSLQGVLQTRCTSSPP